MEIVLITCATLVHLSGQRTPNTVDTPRAHIAVRAPRPLPFSWPPLPPPNLSSLPCPCLAGAKAGGGWGLRCLGCSSARSNPILSPRCGASALVWDMQLHEPLCRQWSPSDPKCRSSTPHPPPPRLQPPAGTGERRLLSSASSLLPVFLVSPLPSTQGLETPSLLRCVDPHHLGLPLLPRPCRALGGHLAQATSPPR